MTQRSLNGTFKLQRSLTGTGILTSVLYGANNLSDVASANQARINLGLTGQLQIDYNSSYYLSISNPFGSTTNETISVNASTNADPYSLAAYDGNGTFYVSTISPQSGSALIYLTNSIQFTQVGLNIADANGSNSISFDGIGNVSFGGGISAGSASIRTGGVLTCGNMSNNGTLKLANLSGYPTSSSAVILQSDLKFFNNNMHIKDANNNNTLTFDNAGNITLYNTLSINGNSILLNSANTFYIQQQGLVAPGTQPYITIIGSSGNIGIGTSTVSYKLDVGGSIRSTGTIYTDTIQANTTSGSIQFKNGSTTLASIDTYGNFDNSAITTVGIKTNFIQNPNFTSGPGGVVYKPLVINSNIKWGAANSIIKDVNNNNTMTFDNAGNVSFYNNITVPNTVITSGIQIPSIATVFAFYDSTGSNTNARTDTNGNIYGSNLYRTIWNQPINTNLSSTSLGSTFPLSQFTSTPLNMTTTTAFRLVVPFAYYGETYILFRAFYQTFSSATITRNIRLEIYSANNSTYSVLLGATLTNPTNNTYIVLLTQLLNLTVGTIYYVAISDYSSSPSAYGFTGGDISLGNT